MQTNFVSKSPLLLGLFLLLGSLLSALSVVVLYIVQFTVPISLSFGLSLFSLVTLLLSSVFLHIYIKEVFIYYIEVYLTNIITGSFKDFTRLIESNHSSVKLSFERIFKELDIVVRSLDEYYSESSILNGSINTKLNEIGLDISERKKSAEVINKKREEAINESRESFKNMIKNIGEIMNESSEDIKEALQELEIEKALQELESKEHTKEDISEANLKEDKEPKLVDEVKASDLEIEE